MRQSRSAKTAPGPRENDDEGEKGERSHHALPMMVPASQQRGEMSYASLSGSMCPTLIPTEAEPNRLDTRRSAYAFLCHCIVHNNTWMIIKLLVALPFGGHLILAMAETNLDMGVAR